MTIRVLGTCYNRQDNLLVSPEGYPTLELLPSDFGGQTPRWIKRRAPGESHDRISQSVGYPGPFETPEGVLAWWAWLEGRHDILARIPVQQALRFGDRVWARLDRTWYPVGRPEGPISWPAITRYSRLDGPEWACWLPTNEWGPLGQPATWDHKVLTAGTPSGLLTQWISRVKRSLEDARRFCEVKALSSFSASHLLANLLSRLPAGDLEAVMEDRFPG